MRGEGWLSIRFRVRLLSVVVGARLVARGATCGSEARGRSVGASCRAGPADMSGAETGGSAEACWLPKAGSSAGGIVAEEFAVGVAAEVCVCVCV
jgi:hypothetical protein